MGQDAEDTELPKFQAVSILFIHDFHIKLDWANG